MTANLFDKTFIKYELCGDKEITLFVAGESKYKW